MRHGRRGSHLRPRPPSPSLSSLLLPLLLPATAPPSLPPTPDRDLPPTLPEPPPIRAPRPRKLLPLRQETGNSPLALSRSHLLPPRTGLLPILLPALRPSRPHAPLHIPMTHNHPRTTQQEASMSTQEDPQGRCSNLCSLLETGHLPQEDRTDRGGKNPGGIRCRRGEASTSLSSFLLLLAQLGPTTARMRDLRVLTGLPTPSTRIVPARRGHRDTSQQRPSQST
mmetsp:Transcript_18268/g.41533  ORF Transcript_18268/g.41533 Transcript_18268/m.41533 type:complete len:225 (-) Transcript_18268:1736-2410(-)